MAIYVDRATKERLRRRTSPPPLPEPEYGPVGPMGPQGFAQPTFDPNAYDAPFQPGGEYGGGYLADRTSEPGGFGRIARQGFSSLRQGLSSVGSDAGDAFQPEEIINRGGQGLYGIARLPFAGIDREEVERFTPGTALGEGLERIPVAGPVLRRTLQFAQPGARLKAAATMATGGVGARYAAEQMGAPEQVQGFADLAGSFAGPMAAGRAGAALGMVDDAARGALSKAEIARLNREVKAIQKRIAKEGMTPELKTRIDSAMGQLFRNAPDPYNQPPPPVTPGGTGEQIGQAMERRRLGDVVEDAMSKARQPRLTPENSYAGMTDEQIWATQREASAAASTRPYSMGELLAQQREYSGMLETAAYQLKRGNRQAFENAVTEAARTEQAIGRDSAIAALQRLGADPVIRARPELMDVVEHRLRALGSELPKPQLPAPPAPRTPSIYAAQREMTKAGDDWIAGMREKPPPESPGLQARIIPGVSPAAATGGVLGAAGGYGTADEDATTGERLGRAAVGAAGGALVGRGVQVGREALKGKTFGEGVAEVLSAPRTMKSTYDLSAPGRQLAPMLTAHPTAIPRVLKAQFKAMKTGNFEASQQALREAPHAKLRDLAGVDITDVNGPLTAREEQIASSLGEALLPGSKNFNQAYTAAINEGRDWLFQQMVKGKDFSDEALAGGALKELQQIGRLVNASTGRGNLGQILTQNQVAGQPIFWAPRLVAGRVQLPLSAFTSTSGTVRKEAARQTVSFVGANLALLGMVRATGVADVNLDPRSSDFGVIRIGTRRYDTWAGYKPLANLVGRLYYGLRGEPNMMTVADSQGRSRLYSKDNLDVIETFLRSKMAPVPGELWSQRTGRDLSGQKVEEAPGGRLGHAAAQLAAPIFLESLIEEVASGDPWAVPANVPYFFGVGGGKYDDRAGPPAPVPPKRQPTQRTQPVRPVRTQPVRTPVAQR